MLNYVGLNYTCQKQYICILMKEKKKQKNKTKQNKKNKNKDFISEWPEYKQKKKTFKNESYSKNQDQFLYWKQRIDPKIIIFQKLILQKINFALWL